MAGKRYRHIFLKGATSAQDFTTSRSPRISSTIPNRDRPKHSIYLQKRLDAAWRKIKERQAVVHVERHGAYIEFIGESGFDLPINSLENRQSGIRLLNVRKETVNGSERTLATVYVPHKQRGYFLKKIQVYATEVTPKKGEPKNAKLVNSISNIRRAVLESFWCVDEQASIPGENPEWVEVWLSSDIDDVIGRFETLLQRNEIRRIGGQLRFPERAVVIILANRRDIERLIEESDDIAELRIAKEVATIFLELENCEQLALVQELLARSKVDSDDDVAVTILDSGVNNGHLLIQPILADEDLHCSWDSEWGVSDDRGHGTLMAGMAAYGDLLDALNSIAPVRISHRLESVKILPPPPEQNPRRLWGYLTAQGLSRAEIQAPERKRIVCMAVTSTDFRDRGRPSSWSAAVDKLTSGSEDDVQRLFVVSAGNIDGSDRWRDYPDVNLTDEIHDPGQAWNALTVGAYTEKVTIRDETLQSYKPLAPAGGLSPFSTTSTTWSSRKWPIKPDLLFEGGNVALGPNDSIFDTEDLKLLSTYHNPQVAQFAPFAATSAATAQASWMAAQIQKQYPEAWAETIRGLMVHTAEWSDTMKQQFLPMSPIKSDYAKLLRICGYGVPSLNRSLYCAANSLTLISQAKLQPFDRRDSRYVTKDMHLYNLPWPSDLLLELGESQVKMRVTLSYFIEPGPWELGWENRYRYPSHALRFEINGPGEIEGEFTRRVNKQARIDGEPPGTEGASSHWIIGEARNVGSIHSDIWEGTAADLAASHLVAIYPVVGWWRERHHLERWNRRCRYTLIVSIYPPSVDIDIYTPVAAQIGIPVPIEVAAM